MTTETLLENAPPPSNSTSPPRDVPPSPPHVRRPASWDIKSALVTLDQARLEGAEEDHIRAWERLCDAVQKAGTVGLDRTRSLPAGAHLDTAFRVLTLDHTAPWPLACWSHHRDLLRSMVHLARARLALIRGQISVTREHLAAARDMLQRLRDCESSIIGPRTTKAIRALDQAERHMEHTAPRAA